MIAAPERPKCMCGQPMIDMFGKGFWLCAHCDQPCEKTESTCTNHELYARRLIRRITQTNPGPEFINRKTNRKYD